MRESDGLAVGLEGYAEPRGRQAACERRARMLVEQRREIEAAAAFRDAIALYREWVAAPEAELSPVNAAL